MTRGIENVRPEDVTIGGCRCIRQTVYPDSRGALIVDLQESSTQDFLQVYHSVTMPGMARDEDTWHIHHEQMDRFFVVNGHIEFALSDGESVQLVTIAGGRPYQLVIPPGVYHCLRTAGPGASIVLNVPDRLYNLGDEGRIPFSDLEAPHPW